LILHYIISHKEAQKSQKNSFVFYLVPFVPFCGLSEKSLKPHKKRENDIFAAAENF
jgi:hypothetical protein